MTLPDTIETKRLIRAEARRLRRELADKDERSRGIARALREMPEYEAARTLMFYVDLPDEVRTRPLIERALREGRRVVVPYCDGDDLGLFLLHDLAELAPGVLGIDEPPPRLRVLPERQVERAAIDLVVVPGVAFDRDGGRIGQGRGYYDRFLSTLGGRAGFIALAYQCQIFSSVPRGEHDIQMDAVVSEDNVYRTVKKNNPGCE